MLSRRGAGTPWRTHEARGWGEWLQPVCVSGKREPMMGAVKVGKEWLALVWISTVEYTALDL